MNRRAVEFVFFWAMLFCAFGHLEAKEIKSPDNTTIVQTNPQAYVPNEIIVKLRPGVTDNTNQQSTGDITWPSSLQRLNSKYKHIKTQSLGRKFERIEQKIKALAKKEPAQLNSREKHILARTRRVPRGVAAPNLDNIYKLRFNLDTNESIQEVLEAYRKNQAVEFAELNYIASAFSVPNDPYYSVQWSLNNIGQSYPTPAGQTALGTSDADIDAPEAWDYTWSSEVIVAVVDTGVDYTHEDLTGKMWSDGSGHYGYDFVNNDNDPMDDFGHGTHCAGIISARADNSLDIAGICWNVKIMAVKGLDSSGSGSFSDLYEAILYAVDNGADVISNSWGSPYNADLIDLAIAYAYNHGVIIVAAAGNNNNDAHSYPAYYNNVISVAATDSSDNKASFSSYGDWVDLAAPGADILSLRAANTDMYLGQEGYNPGERFVPFGNPNAKMYIASGTSMACPMVSGACAVMFCANPAMTSEEATSILMNTADPIDAWICSSGRLNLYEATIEAIKSKSRGHLTLDSDYYNCDSTVGIYLLDADLAGENTHNISITSASGDSETVTLIKEDPIICSFRGTIQIVAGGPSIEDGLLEVTNEDVIYANYYDANYGDGNPATVTDTARIDCVPPVIPAVEISIRQTPKLTVTFNTNEPATGKVNCRLTCGGPNDLESEHPDLRTSHIIEVSPILPLTTYYLEITVADAGGNEVIDSNSGNCYIFTTTGPGEMHVPGEFETIQSAVDQSWPGAAILVADGDYSGPGNRDIDFEGKAITVKSENGPMSCVINCQGTPDEPHRGFYFHSFETPDTVLDGFTITNGFGPEEQTRSDDDTRLSVGGGICCVQASPTIKNCVVNYNSAEFAGGGIGCFQESSANISDCVIFGNQASWGAGIICDYSNPVIANCIISNHYGDGAMYLPESSPVVRNCLFTGNSSPYAGGAVYCIGYYDPWGNTYPPSNPSFYNCTFTGNSALYDGGAVYYYRNCHATAVDCIFWGNSAGRYGHEICVYGVYPYSSMTASYCDIQDTSGGVYIGSGCSFTNGAGIIHADPRFTGGPKGNYYLSQINAGQVLNSPCINTGSTAAANLGLNLKTTRTDEIIDTGTVDIGYHYPITVNPDLSGNAFVDFIDYSLFANDWLLLQDPCHPDDGDITRNGQVDLYDLEVLAEEWLVCCVTKAMTPWPPNRASAVSRFAVLEWKGGQKSTSQNVYFGTDFNEVRNAIETTPGIFMGNQDANYWDVTCFAPAGLNYNSTYYWRIDCLASGCFAKGNVWSFTTSTGKAENPIPENDQNNASLHTILIWSPGAQAVSHDIYFGIDFNEVNDANITNSNVYMGNSDVNHLDTNNYDSNGLEPGATFFWRIDEHNPLDVTKGDVWSFSVVNPEPDPNLVGWWNFDEGVGTITYDSAGSNNGILRGNPVWATGKVGNFALVFDGNGDYSEVADSPALDIVSEITIAAWVNVFDSNDHSCIVAKQPSGSAGPDYPGNYEFRIEQYSGQLSFLHQTTSGTAFSSYTTMNDLNFGVWQHAAVTVGNSQVKFYLNGVWLETFAQSGTFGILNNEPVRIGTRKDNYSYFKGSMDDVRIYNRALNAGEISQLYQSGL